MTTYITTARFEFEDGTFGTVQWENKFSIKWTALMHKSHEIGAARFVIAGATHVEKRESPCAPVFTSQNPFLVQALAILDALEKLPEGDVFHAGKVLGGNGAWFVRREKLSSDEVDRIAGTSGRDVLAQLGTVIEAEDASAQLVQSHPEGV